MLKVFWWRTYAGVTFLKPPIPRLMVRTLSRHLSRAFATATTVPSSEASIRARPSRP
jgi:hypothetical protein